MKRILLFMSVLLIGHISLYAALGDKIEAESFTTSEGAEAETNESLSGGGNVGYVTNGTWIMFEGLNFTGEENRIDIAAAGSTGGNVEFRIGAADGTLIGTAVIEGTEGWSDYQIYSANIEAISGVNDLYLVFTGGDGYLFNVDYFILTSGSIPVFTLTTEVEPAEAGVVVRDFEGPEYAQGTSLVISAEKNLGFEFSHWQNSNGTIVSEEKEINIKMMNDTTLIAFFDEVETYSLEVSIDTGSFVVQPVPDIINGVLMYNAGTQIDIIAAPAFGFQFKQWEDQSGQQLSTSASYSFELNSDVSLTAIVNEVTEYALPQWTFDNEYYSNEEDETTYFTPTAVPVENFLNDNTAWLYPDNQTYGEQIGLLPHCDEFSINDVRGSISARITWSGATTLSDVTDAQQHLQYYQFQFPTTDMANIELSFSFSGGQNNADDYLALAYSIDEGLTWIDGGKYNAGEHWSNFMSYTASINGADDKDLVIVRLIGVVSNDDSNNFNLDNFVVNGVETGVPEDDLLACYSFDGHIEDGSGNGYHGTIYGAPEFIEGRSGKALNFRGAESGDAVATGIHFAPEGSFSIALWFKVNEWDSKFGNVLIGDRGDKNASGVDNGFQIRQFAESEDDYGWLCFTSRGVASDKDFDPRKGINSNELGFNTDMPYMRGIYPGSWKHLVAVYNKELGKKQIYINGNLVVDGTVNSQDEYPGYLPAAAYDQILIGARNDNDSTSLIPETSFNGAIDEVRIYTAALDEDKIEMLYKSYGDDLTDINAYWKFNDTAKPDVADEVGHSNGLVINDAEYVGGHEGTAVSFAGLSDTSYVMVDDNEFINQDSGSFSISAIVKFDAATNAGNEYQVLFKGGTEHANIQAKGLEKSWETFGKWFTIAFKGGELRFAIDDDVNKTQLGIDATELFTGEEWVLVTGVRDTDEDSLKLYVNGKLMGAMEDVTETSISTEGIPLIIGNNKDQNLAFQGGIDELKIFGRALKAHEVEDLAFDYNLGKLPLKDNANITGISVNGIPVQPFMSIVKDYELTLPEGTSEILVEVFGADEDASIDISTTTEQSIIVITAQDGTTTNTFTINYTYETGVEKISDNGSQAFFTDNNMLELKSSVKIRMYEIFDHSGRLLTAAKVNENTVSVDTSQFGSKRLFIIRITDENNSSQVLKVMKPGRYRN